jgi:hypothetical protein
MARPSEQRPEREQLVGRHLAMEDVPAAQREPMLEVDRCQHLTLHDQRRDIGGVLGERLITMSPSSSRRACQSPRRSA